MSGILFFIFASCHPLSLLCRYAYPIHVSTRFFDVTYLNTENYMHFSKIQIKKIKKDRPTDPLNFQAKRANKPLFF